MSDVKGGRRETVDFKVTLRLFFQTQSFLRRLSISVSPQTFLDNTGSVFCRAASHQGVAALILMVKREINRNSLTEVRPVVWHQIPSKTLMVCSYKNKMSSDLNLLENLRHVCMLHN